MTTESTSTPTATVYDPKRHVVSKRSMFKHVVHQKGHPLHGKEIALYVREKTGNKSPGTGEAHGNTFIDNCGICAPNWGEVDEYKPVDPEEARALGLAVHLCDVTNAQIIEEEARGGVLLPVEKVRRKNGGLCSCFSVLAYPSLKAIG